jgi:hypothetical protein
MVAMDGVGPIIAKYRYDQAAATWALIGTVTSMASKTVQPDSEQARGTNADLSRLLGTWFAIKLDENRITKLLLTEEDGTLLVRPYGSPDSEPYDWGQAAVTPFVASGSTTATGFQAHCRFGDIRVNFMVIENHGVLLTHTFTTFHDGSGRPSEFGKSYFRRAAEELVSTSGISTGTISGEWVNSNPATTWVAGFTITETAGAPVLRVRGASDPIDWGETELTASQDRHGESHFYGVYDLEPFEAVVGVLSVKNLVSLSQFRRYKDESIPTFSREFFFRNR